MQVVLQGSEDMGVSNFILKFMKLLKVYIFAVKYCVYIKCWGVFEKSFCNYYRFNLGSEPLKVMVAIFAFLSFTRAIKHNDFIDFIPTYFYPYFKTRFTVKFGVKNWRRENTIPL